jgi:hypothetical protein
MEDALMVSPCFSVVSPGKDDGGHVRPGEFDDTTHILIEIHRDKTAVPSLRVPIGVDRNADQLPACSRISAISGLVHCFEET